LAIANHDALPVDEWAVRVLEENGATNLLPEYPSVQGHEPGGSLDRSVSMRAIDVERAVNEAGDCNRVVFEDSTLESGQKGEGCAVVVDPSDSEALGFKAPCTKKGGDKRDRNEANGRVSHTGSAT
jgi:hypothetical protein